MSKKIQLSIPIPCHENWDNMSPVQKGKFCGSCQKQVIDFSNMSDREVAQFFKKPSTGSVCGRFMTDQLERDLEISRKRIPWLKYFFQIALPALFISKAAGQTQKIGKIARPTEKDTIRVPATNEMRTLGMILPTTIIPAKDEKQDKKVCDTVAVKPVVYKTSIKGRVVDENGEAIPFASIETGKKGFRVMADELGNFSIPVSSLSGDSVLQVSSAGFEKTGVQVNREDAVDSELLINLRSGILLPEVVLTSRQAMNSNCSWQTGTVSMIQGEIVKKQAKKEDTRIIPETATSEPGRILVYPNPVTTGANINIELSQKEEGYYLFQLLNPGGQSVHFKEIWIDAAARLLNIDMPPLAAGSYFLVLTNKRSGRKLTAKIIIE